MEYLKRKCNVHDLTFGLKCLNCGWHENTNISHSQYIDLNFKR